MNKTKEEIEQLANEKYSRVGYKMHKEGFVAGYMKCQQTNSKSLEENEGLKKGVNKLNIDWLKAQNEIKSLLVLKDDLTKMTQSRDSWEEMKHTATKEWKNCIIQIKELEKAIQEAMNIKELWCIDYSKDLKDEDIGKIAALSNMRQSFEKLLKK